MSICIQVSKKKKKKKTYFTHSKAILSILPFHFTTYLISQFLFFNPIHSLSSSPILSFSSTLFLSLPLKQTK